MEKLNEILKRDNRYKMEAYIFVLNAVPYTQRLFHKERHISGEELLLGIKRLAFKMYGKFVRDVFMEWGIHSSIDFGYIVFNLVDAGLLSKQPTDSIEDFKDVFDFDSDFNYEIKIKE